MIRRYLTYRLTYKRPSVLTKISKQFCVQSVSYLNEMPVKVAVIGAGAGGLCALRHLVAKPQIFEAVCFEQCAQVGGTWVYTDEVGKDKYGLPIHSSMYKNLKTNLPKEVMPFPDFPFRENLPSFIRHQDVLHYLEDYSQNFNITDKIMFHTKVDRVHPEMTDTGTKWKVTYSNVQNPSQTTTDTYDGVIVCNGHYSDPLMPTFPGSDKFKGRVMHSHDYRRPEEFKNQTVVVLGAQSSGLDIMVELSSYANKVIISHNKPALTTKLPSTVEQRQGIKAFTEDSVIFADDSQERADTVILCTGYIYTFPFLTNDCHLHIEDERITPLYKHLIHTEYPSLSFIGLCKVICPFPQFHFQVLLVLAVLEGTYKLPSKEEMDCDTEKDFQQRLSDGLPARHAHHMSRRQWAYNDELADMVNAPRLQNRVFEMYQTVHDWRHQDIAIYKKKNLRLIGPDSFQVVD